ncbi:helix-turn-helix domain-containing protein [Hymenobacter pini]|uniref:helix-turn-helix domain-containing protein n=1 Tax=Hymenobacter pini TaxID=2880879 RepID=UPI001CF134E8|nr:helix-turn-helix transcriptional regulator [Hymenobacter pini]MCA8830643.1 helix-turn-helix domain-containing protein [Hymenobacter pini]
MLDRIRQLLTDRQLSSTQFADAIGVSRPVISHILSGRNKPSLEVVQKILSAFPDVSTTWLLNGTGAMKSVGPAIHDAATPKRRVAQTQPAVAEPAPEPQTEPLQASVAQSKDTLLDEPIRSAGQAKPSSIPDVSVAASPSEPTEAPLRAAVVPSATVVSNEQAAANEPVGADWAQALAEPGKTIRRIVIFYQDGTFADYQPEVPSSPARR